MTSNKQQLEQFLTIAKQAAAAAEKVIEKYYLRSRDQQLAVKADNSPVTQADKEAEAVIRQLIGQHFPEHGIFGEELGKSNNQQSDFLWLIDPIDGTKSFVRGYPFFSTQIALMYRNQIIVGVSNAPLFGEMAWAYRGGGAFINGKKIQIHQVCETHSMCVSSGNIQSLIAENWQDYGRLLQKFGKIRGYGDFYHYHLLAAGKIDLVIESDVNILDIAALSLIVTEAGGIFTELSGQTIDLDSTSVLAGNDYTHRLGLETLNE